MDLGTVITGIVSGLGGGAVVVAGLAGWLGKVWAGRILQGDRAQHMKELEEEKAKHNEDLQKLKTLLEVQLDRSRWPISREDQLAAEFRDAVQKLTTAMASALHSICWLTWLSTVAPEDVTAERTEKYDEEMHSLLPKISGALIRLATIDSDSYNRLRDHVNSIYALDVEVAEACKTLQRDRTPDGQQKVENIGELRGLHAKSTKLERGIPDEILDLVNDRIKMRAIRTIGEQPVAPNG